MVDPQLGVRVQHAAHLIQWGPCLCALVLMKASVKLQLQNKECKCQIRLFSHMSMACLANGQNKKDKTPSFNQVHTQCFVCIDSCFLFPTHLSFLAQLHVSTILPSCKKNTRLSMSFQCSHMGVSHHVVCVSAASHLPTCLDQYLL